MLASLTIGYASCGPIGGFLQLWISTRMVALLGGSIVVTSFFITYLYTANTFVVMACSFGILYGIGIGLIWGYAL